MSAQNAVTEGWILETFSEPIVVGRGDVFRDTKYGKEIEIGLVVDDVVVDGVAGGPYEPDAGDVVGYMPDYEERGTVQCGTHIPADHLRGLVEEGRLEPADRDGD